ncbi:MAG: hypothetical protein U0P30_01390, partial [Vicinamibacterales bacterium]
VALWPHQPGRAAGVVGGVALIALSYKAIVAGVSGLWAGAPEGLPPVENRPDFTSSVDGADEAPEAVPARPPAPRGFVKFFTRHAILAVGAYVMIARFEFDPMAMLAGVTAPAIAATVEVVRTVRARQGGPQSR